MQEASGPHPSVVNWYTNTPLQVLTTSESLGWNTVSVSIDRQQALLDEIAPPFFEDDIFGMHLEGSPRVRLRFFDGSLIDQYLSPPSLLLFPRRSEYVGTQDSASTYASFRLQQLSAWLHRPQKHQPVHT